MSRNPRPPDGRRIERFAVVPADPHAWVKHMQIAASLPSSFRLVRATLHPLSVVGGIEAARTKLRTAERHFPDYAKIAGFRLVRTNAFRTKDVSWTPDELASLPSAEAT